jgi:hypothetical protein
MPILSLRYGAQSLVAMEALWCKAAGDRGSKTGVEVAGYGDGMWNVRFKADVEGVGKRQDAHMVHPEAAGGCRARETRGGAGWVVDQGGDGAGARRG